MEHSAGRYVCGEIETENCSIMVKRPAMQASISLLGRTVDIRVSKQFDANL